jgi:hypothetical protein
MAGALYANQPTLVSESRTARESVAYLLIQPQVVDDRISEPSDEVTRAIGLQLRQSP